MTAPAEGVPALGASENETADAAAEAPQRPMLPVWILTAVLTVLAIAVTATLVGDPHLIGDLPVPWWALAPLFLLTVTYPIFFEVRGQSRNVTLCQIPLQVGFLFTGPVGVILARVTGGAVSYAFIGRFPPMKWTFNCASLALDSAVGLIVFATVAGTPDEVGLRVWVALIAGGLASEVVGAVNVALVLRLVQGARDLREDLPPTLVGAVTAVGASALTLIAAGALLYSRWTAVALIVVTVLAICGFHAFSRLAEQRERLEQLYAFTRQLGPIGSDSDAVSEALTQVRELLYAEHLELSLLARDLADPVVISTEEPTVSTTAAGIDEDRLSQEVLATLEPALISRRTRAWEPSRRGDARSSHMAAPLATDRQLLGVLRASHRSGEVRGFDRNDLTALQTLATSLSAAMEKGQLLEGLQRAATRDSLTGVANLDACRASLQTMLTDGNSGGGVLVLLVDIDRFQDINDTLGHVSGDVVLRQIAQRLVSAAPPGAVVGRVGGDQFALAMRGAAAEDLARLAALGVKARVEGSVSVETLSADIRISVGIARAPEHGIDAATLLRRAEMAMYNAKHSAGRVLEWEASQEREGSRRLEVVAALRRALANGSLDVAYQPKLSLRARQPIGCEALLRWEDGDLGTVRPDEFIPLAETSGLIGALTTYVLRQGLIACRRWQDLGANVGIAVNLSARSLLDPLIVGQVSGLIAESGVEPHRLTLELTESSVMDNPVRSVEVLRQLRACGVRLSIDDFGTGYASLTYVKGLPVHEVKIDRSFISNVHVDPTDQAVVRAVNDLGHSLGLTVVAEGVETTGQASQLLDYGVDEVQGYLFGRPMPAREVTSWLYTNGALAG